MSGRPHRAPKPSAKQQALSTPDFERNMSWIDFVRIRCREGSKVSTKAPDRLTQRQGCRQAS